MTSLTAYAPGISLAIGTLVSIAAQKGFSITERQKRLHSMQTPPGWLFMVAWTLQAVSLGQVGQGIAHGPAFLQGLWYGFAFSLGPLYGLQTILESQESVPESLALWYSVAYVLGLLVYLLVILNYALEQNTPQNYFIWPTVAWLAFALFLTISAVSEHSNPTLFRSKIETQRISTGAFETRGAQRFARTFA